jgi:hypothetical protein
MDSSVARQIIDVLERVGITTFQIGFHLTSGEQWPNRIQEELSRADCAILILEAQFNRSPDSKYLTQDIESLLSYNSNNPKFTIIPVIESSLSPDVIPTELQKFQGIYFTQAITSSDLGLLVDTIFRTWHLTEQRTPTLEQLAAEAKVVNTRLTFILSQSRILDIVLLLVAAVVTGIGVALSIPSVLVYWSLPDYWLLLAPIIAVSGAIATIYLSIRERQERRRITIAALVKNQLDELVKSAELLREEKRQFRLDKY